jgi:RNA polymerase sigma-70 factor (ECF subfamily)
MNEDLQIDRLKNGDKNALAILYDNYSGALFGVVLRICRDREKAEDLLQEIFLTIWEKIGQYDPEKGKFYTWAYRIARNKTLNALRKSDPLIQKEDLGVYKDIEAKNEEQDFDRLYLELDKLDEHHKKVIELVYFKGLTHREAHQIMGVPLGTFKSYVSQALNRLRENYPMSMALLLLCLDVIDHG